MWIEDTGPSQHQPAMGLTPSLHPTALIKHSEVGMWTRIGAQSKLANSRFGDWSYCTERCDIINATIGKFCSIAAHVRINPGNHPTWRASQHHFMYRAASYNLGVDEDWVFHWRAEHHVTIGHDVWIGHGAVVLPGVRIGNGAVIGAGAVVSKDVPDYTIMGGVPARKIRDRHDPAIAERLIALGWWDWDHARIKAALDDFRQLSVDDFLVKYE